MKIRYKNFEIEQDTYCYILTEYGIAGDKAKIENQGKEVILNQVYPSTLENCFKDIRYKLQKNKPATVELDTLINELKELDSMFLSEVKLLLNNK